MRDILNIGSDLGRALFTDIIFTQSNRIAFDLEKTAEVAINIYCYIQISFASTLKTSYTHITNISHVKHFLIVVLSK